MTQRTLTGVKTDAEREYEVRHRRIAREAAAQGIVLLKNEDGLLPLDPAVPVALYGSGAVMTIKGGTGSGDVNSRHTVSIREGMEKAGFSITTGAWLDAYEREYEEAHLAWKNEIWRKIGLLEGGADGNGGANFFDSYVSTPFVIPSGEIPREKAPDDPTDTAIFVLSRTAGEGGDRHVEPGDYLLTDGESALYDAVRALYAHVILAVNTGGLVDLSFAEKADAILYLNQPGMEAGLAFADVLSGAVNPSAKLTDTWTLRYADYPNAETFSHCSGDVTREEYVEGIYVGYRYFDTFGVPVRYPFGFGLSYTTFDVTQRGLEHFDLGTRKPRIEVTVRVQNTGSCSGREVVQLYVSCPQDGLPKEFRRLAGYAKTRLLAPGEMEDLKIGFPLYQLASFREADACWVLEAGKYLLMTGTSLADTELSGVISAEQEMIFAQTEHICAPQTGITELEQSKEIAASVSARREALLAEAEGKGLPVITLHTGDLVTEEITYDGAYEDTPPEVRDFVETLTAEELIRLATGEIGGGAGLNEEGEMDEESSQLGSTGIAVPGSAAQTSACAAGRGLSEIVLADGPAGLRLSQSYQVVDGVPQPVHLLASLEGGYLLPDAVRNAPPVGETYYQYCTAFPVGTQLAQSWDPEVFRAVGAAVGEELVLFSVTLWLAPGMNIHRNPLCGRNFEYYSEDPLVAGLSAAAMTEGVQSVEGVGTTIKHFACNNQEDNRMGCDSVLSERVLREIYLKGFEICVKKAQPMSIMTSYNLVNGVHAANSYDLCTKAARNEWGFAGVIMTDWTTTLKGPDCTAAGCMRAGNDLVMPGAPSDHENLRSELAEGTLSLADLKRSAARLVNTVWKSRYGRGRS